MAKVSCEDGFPGEVAPLITLSSKIWNNPIDQFSSNSEQLQQVGHEVVKALQTSGFLRIQSDLMPLELQQSALDDATKWLTTTCQEEDPMVVQHPTDPKTYVMLETKNVKEHKEKGELILLNFTPTLVKYWNACEQLKRCVLRAIGVGLNLAHPEDLAAWHDQGSHSAMRLLHYPPANPSTGNRCKAHSDYGTVTLLSTDGVSGLEIFLNGKWWQVPHVPGAMVVNIGSLLSDWTKRSGTQPLLATVHRVAGPASENSSIDPKVLKLAMSQGRTSIAFFADPDDETPLSSDNGMTMDEYIQWRSGSNSAGRIGVAFTEAEAKSLVDPNSL